MLSGTQYMLQKNSCTRFAFCFCIWYPGIHKRVWNNVKKFQLKTDVGAAGLAQSVLSQCRHALGSFPLLLSPKLLKSTAKLRLMQS